MRPLLRWLIHGKPKPPVVIQGELLRIEDPRTDALVAIAEAVKVQAVAMERFANAAESVLGTLERAEQRVLASEPMKQLEP